MLAGIFLLFMILFLYTDFTRQECKVPKSADVGTVIFNPTDVSRPCWSADEIAILTARMILEDVLPDPTRIILDTNKSVDDLVNYFILIFNNIRQNTRGRGKHLMLVALCDLLGGYMHMAVLPIARRGYYAGVIDYAYMEKLIQLYEELKWFLRTNGQGWASPMDTTKIQIAVQPIDLDSDVLTKDNRSCCRKLIYYDREPVRVKKFVPNSILDEIKDTAKTKRENNKECTVYFPLPFFDSKVYPSSIVVPLKRYALRNIESRKASYLIMKYFLAAHHCLEFLKASESAKRNFRNRLYNWILKEVDPKLGDDKFYAAFGGILRVQSTLKSMGANLNQSCDIVREPEPEIGALAPKQTRLGPVLFIIMLIIIILWFIIGTCFICRRMRANQKCKCCKSDGGSSCSISSSSKWSNWSRSSSRTCKCCSTSEKSSGDYMSSTDTGQSKSKTSIKHFKSSPCVCSSDGPAVIETKHSMKVLPSIAELSENSSQSKQMSRKITFPAEESTLSSSDLDRRSKEPTNKQKIRVCVPKGAKTSSKDVIPCPKLSKATSLSSSMSKTTGVGEIQADDREIDNCLCLYPEDISSAINGDGSSKEGIGLARVDQVNYTYNNTCACHSSLSGNYDSKLPANQKAFIFGYDFHSSSGSTDEDSDDTDVRN